MFSPDEINQLLEALRPELQAMIKEGSMVADPEGDLDITADTPADPVADPVADESPALDPMSDDDAAFGASVASRFMKRYSKEDGDFDSEGALQYMNSMDEEDKSLFQRYMKEKCDDEDYKAKYAKCCPGTDVSDKDADGMNKGAAKYKKERDDLATKYAKQESELSSLKSRYSKLQGQFNAVEAERDEAIGKIETVEKKARYAKRHATLVEMNVTEGIICDADDEMKDCEHMTDEQFDRHIDRCRTKYAKCPIEQAPFKTAEPKKYLQSPKSEKYAKDAREKVIQIRKEGGEADYTEVLNWMVKNDSADYKELATTK